MRTCDVYSIRCEICQREVELPARLVDQRGVGRCPRCGALLRCEWRRLTCGPSHTHPEPPGWPTAVERNGNTIGAVRSTAEAAPIRAHSALDGPPPRPHSNPSAACGVGSGAKPAGMAGA